VTRSRITVAVSLFAACALVLWIALAPLERALVADSIEYLGLATNLARSGDFLSHYLAPAPELYRTPAYPALLALLGAPESTGRLRLVLLVQVGCVLAMAALLFRATRPRPRLLPPLLLLTSPLVWIAAGSILTELLFGFCLFLSARGIGVARNRSSWLVSGLCLGAATLFRPVGLFLVPVGALLLWTLRARLEISRRDAIVWLVAALFLPSLWTLHNGVRHGYWGLSKSALSYASSVYGHAPLSRGTPDMKTSLYDQTVDANSTFIDILHGVREHPLDAVRVLASGLARVGLGLGEFTLRRIFAGDTYDRSGAALSPDLFTIVPTEDGLAFPPPDLQPRTASKAAKAALLLWSALSTLAIYFLAATGAKQALRELRGLRSSRPPNAGALVALAWSVTLLLTSAGPVANARFRMPIVPLLLLAVSCRRAAPIHTPVREETP